MTKDKIIVGTEVLLLCMIVGILRINATSSNPPSSEVNYNKNSQENVQGSINDLYSKVAYGDAEANEIFKGKKALVKGKEVVGTYLCPGNESLGIGNATNTDIISGKRAWVNGKLVDGSLSSIELVSTEELQIGDEVVYMPDKIVYTMQSCEEKKNYSTYGQRATGSNEPSMYVWKVLQKNSDGTVDIILTEKNEVCLSRSATPDLLNEIAQNFQAKGITARVRHAGYMSDDKDALVRFLSFTGISGWYASVDADQQLQGFYNGKIRNAFSGFSTRTLYILPIVTIRSDVKIIKEKYISTNFTRYYINA